MKNRLSAPIKGEDLENLRIGDYIYYSGILATGRDDVHHRVVTLGMDCPADLSGLAIFHAGPIVRETPQKNTLIAIGPTSSIRMEEEAPEFIEKTGVKLLIGKGAMGEKTALACKKHKAIHCVYPGGCAVKASSCVEEIVDVKWRELGMPECMWILRVKDFGPLIVAIDTCGNNLFEENQRIYASQRDRCLEPIYKELNTFMSE